MKEAIILKKSEERYKCLSCGEFHHFKNIIKMSTDYDKGTCCNCNSVWWFQTSLEVI